MTNTNTFDASTDSDSGEFHYPGADSDLVPEAPPSVSVSEDENVIVDSESEEFHYPGADPLPSTVAAGKQPERDNNAFTPTLSTSGSPAPQPSNSSLIKKKKPSPAQLESLHAAASSGDLKLLQNLFKNAARNEDVEEFALANDASVRTGLTALHAAASRGHTDIVKWRTCDFCIATWN
jgi:Ankyrin repeats (many copies)